MPVQMKVTQTTNEAHQSESFLVKVKGYLIKNPGAFFIIVFDLLIFSCAFLVVVEENSLVNNVAISAYCFLVIGVILQAIVFLKNRVWSVDV
ncbi:MAG: hypothetical protein QMD20_04805 [Candidatus Bathyarchaeia archaeon]|nr:hypothetical protein [Candidatus Bathyarchaeia archaeon]